MAISSINFMKVGGHSFTHNDRSESKSAKTIFAEHSHLNECSRSAIDTKAMFDRLFKQSIAKVEGRTRRAKKENCLVEALVNLNAGHTLEDVQRLAAKIEKETGFTCLQMAVHKDEGEDKGGKLVRKNHHAHLSFFTLNRDTGRQLFRREILTRDKLSQLQDLTASELGMQRGKKGSKAVRLDHKAFKEAKRREERVLAKAKDVVAQYRDERDTLKASGEATQRDYQELKLAYDALKSRAKSKDLTIEELQKQLSEARETSKALKGDLRYSEELLRASRANYERLVKENEELKREVMQLKAELRQRMPMTDRQQKRKELHSLEAERNALQGELTEIREVEPTAEMFNTPDPSPSLPKKASAFDRLEEMKSKKIIEELANDEKVKGQSFDELLKELAKDADQKRDQGLDFGADFSR